MEAASAQLASWGLSLRRSVHRTYGARRNHTLAAPRVAANWHGHTGPVSRAICKGGTRLLQCNACARSGQAWPGSAGIVRGTRARARGTHGDQHVVHGQWPCHRQTSPCSSHSPWYIYVQAPPAPRTHHVDHSKEITFCFPWNQRRLINLRAIISKLLVLLRVRHY